MLQHEYKKILATECDVLLAIFLDWVSIYHFYLYNVIDPRPSTNQSTSLKSGSLFAIK